MSVRCSFRALAYEVRDSYQCPEILRSPLMINFYDGQVIPEAEASVDVVAFFSVLHHAARATTEPKFNQRRLRFCVIGLY